MRPDSRYRCEGLYTTPWGDAKRERLSLALDEAAGRVRPAYARWVRGRCRALVSADGPGVES